MIHYFFLDCKTSYSEIMIGHHQHKRLGRIPDLALDLERHGTGERALAVEDEIEARPSNADPISEGRCAYTMLGQDDIFEEQSWMNSEAVIRQNLVFVVPKVLIVADVSHCSLPRFIIDR